MNWFISYSAEGVNHGVVMVKAKNIYQARLKADKLVPEFEKVINIQTCTCGDESDLNFNQFYSRAEMKKLGY